MVCRTTALGSAVTSLARLRSGLEDQQTLSAYHALLRQGQDVVAPTVGQRLRLINELRDVTLNDQNLSETRRDSLVGRFDQADTQPMDGRSFYAAQRILTRTTQLQTVLTSFYDTAARDLGLSRAQTAEFVRDQRAHARTSRVMEDPDVALAVRTTMRSHTHGISSVDRYTAYALHHLQTMADTARTQNSAPAVMVWNDCADDHYASYGYAEQTGRFDLQSRTGVIYSYPISHGRYAGIHQQLQSGTFTASEIHDQFRATNAHGSVYANAAEAAAAGTVNRCGTCGQFAGPGHACAIRDSAQERRETLNRARAGSTPNAVNNTATSVVGSQSALPAPMPRLDRPVQGAALLHRGESGVTRMPTAAQIRATATDGPVQFPVIAALHATAESGTHGARGDLRGRVQVSAQENPDGTSTYLVTPVTTPGPTGGDQLRCTCPDYQANYDCVHVRQLVADVTRRVNGTEDWDHYLPLAQAQVAADLAREHAESLDAQTTAQATWGGQSTCYAANPAAFRTVYKAAKARAAAGEEAIPYMTVNATGGLGAPGTGRAFGVELEFEFPESMPWDQRAAALTAIGEDLHQANLTSDPYQNGYHSAERNGYSEGHAGGWAFERDETVAGEIVSPIMYDTPETWQNIQQVCDIVKTHGGIANRSTGSHVHVSAHNYDHTVENYNQLMSGFAENEDVLYRMAMNPEANRHRGTYWCRPNNVPSAGYNSVDSARDHNDGHSNGVNMAAMYGGQSDHVEYRMWDGTLSPAAIQSQVKLSLGMTEAAFRGSPARRTPEPLGSHRSYNRQTYGEGRRLTGADFDADTASFRGMVDGLFDRNEDKEQMTALFAVTKWQRTTR
ncbi:amidoligase family protein [Tessaracoccus sp.]